MICVTAGDDLEERLQIVLSRGGKYILNGDKLRLHSWLSSLLSSLILAHYRDKVPLSIITTYNTYVILLLWFHFSHHYSYFSVLIPLLSSHLPTHLQIYMASLLVVS